MRRPLLVLAALAALGSAVAVVGSAATLGVTSASIDTFDSAIPASTTTSTTAGGDTTPPAFVSAQYFDTDTNGRIDRIVVTYDEPLGQAGTGSDWTVANRASGMGSAPPTLTIAGSAVRLDLAEATSGFATGPTNLQVSVAAGIVRDAAGNPAAGLTGQVVADKARPIPMSLTIANGATNDGKPETGDHITVSFSEVLSRQSICSNGAAGWVGSGALGSVDVQIADGTPETLSATSTACAGGLRFGSVALGVQDYVDATRTFTGGSLSHAGAAIQIVLGSPSGSTNDRNGNSNATFTPSALLTDPSGNAAVGARSTGNQKHF